MEITGAIEVPYPVPAGAVQNGVELTGAVTIPAPVPAGVFSSVTRIAGSAVIPAPVPAGVLRRVSLIAGSVEIPVPVPAGSLKTVTKISGSVAIPAPVPAGALRQVMTIAGASMIPAPTAGPATTLQTGKVYIINAKTLAVMSTTLPAIAALGDGEMLYLATPTGLACLSGAIEAGASPRITSGEMDLTPGKACTVHPAYATLSSGVALELVANRDEDGTAQTATYDVPVVTSTKERKRTIPMGKGAVGDAWQITLRTPSQAAAPFSVSLLQLEINSSKR